MPENTEEIKIVGFGGSLRKGSYNMMLLKEVQRLMPENSMLDIVDITGIPFYNEDAENDKNPSIVNFKESLKYSDGFIIATPEYNYSIPGFLKNAIDSISKPADQNPFAGKHGVIYKHSLVAGAPDGRTGKRARRLACKICITARADLRGTSLSDEIINGYIENIQKQ